MRAMQYGKEESAEGGLGGGFPSTKNQSKNVSLVFTRARASAAPPSAGSGFASGPAHSTAAAVSASPLALRRRRLQARLGPAVAGERLAGPALARSVSPALGRAVFSDWMINWFKTEQRADPNSHPWPRLARVPPPKNSAAPDHRPATPIPLRSPGLRVRPPQQPAPRDPPHNTRRGSPKNSARARPRPAAAPDRAAQLLPCTRSSPSILPLAHHHRLWYT